MKYAIIGVAESGLNTNLYKTKDKKMAQRIKKIMEELKDNKMLTLPLGAPVVKTIRIKTEA